MTEIRPIMFWLGGGEGGGLECFYLSEFLNLVFVNFTFRFLSKILTIGWLLGLIFHWGGVLFQCFVKAYII